MIEIVIAFLAMLNPFALFIYLLPINKELGLRKFAEILIRASAISLAIYLVFAWSGDYLFTNILNIEFANFQVFGGLVLIALSLSFIIQGKKSLITTKGELSEIAQEVALPYIVGAGTITLSILAGRALGAVQATFVLTAIVSINAVIILLLASIRHSMKKQAKEVLDKNLEILLRLNGYIIGAFGVDLFIRGVQSLLM